MLAEMGKAKDSGSRRTKVLGLLGIGKSIEVLIVCENLEVLVLLEGQKFWLLRESRSSNAVGNLEVLVLLES